MSNDRASIAFGQVELYSRNRFLACTNSNRKYSCSRKPYGILCFDPVCNEDLQRFYRMHTLNLFRMNSLMHFRLLRRAPLDALPASSSWRRSSESRPWEAASPGSARKQLKPNLRRQRHLILTHRLARFPWFHVCGGLKIEWYSYYHDNYH